MKQVIKTTAHKAMTTALGLAGLVLLAGATSYAQAQGRRLPQSSYPHDCALSSGRRSRYDGTHDQ